MSIRAEISGDHLSDLSYRNKSIRHGSIDNRDDTEVETAIESLYKVGDIRYSKLLMMKRIAFIHEDEYRLVAFSPVEK